MKKLVRLGTTLLHETSWFGSRNEFTSNFYCTKAMPSRRSTRPLEGSTIKLFRRISPVGDPNISIVPILNQWIEEGQTVDKETLIGMMKKLMRFNRFSHALEFSKWMTDNRHFELTSSDVACRLKLISETKGKDEAEKYFNNLSQNLQTQPVYGALLNCYAAAQCDEKAEEVMQKMRIMNSCYGIANHIWDYNVMLNLYRKTANMEKFNALLQEMEENGVVRTNATLGIQLSAYADVKDIVGKDKIVRILESDPNVVSDWTNYIAAASGYTEAGFFDKALEMLKKVEAHVKGHEYQVYNYLLTQYGAIGRKDEVLRVWSLYKQKNKVYNKSMSSTLFVKLGDIEMAEEIFGEWESQSLTYDMNIPTIMIHAYSSKGLIGKAEALLDKAMSKGGKPYAATWRHLIEGYVLTEQYQKAIETTKKLVTSSVTGRKPLPTVASVKACLKYLKGVGDTEQTKEFIKLLVDIDVISLDQLEELSSYG